MTNGFSTSKKADVSDKYNHVRGELKRARARIHELEDRLGLLEETLAMRDRELAALRPRVVSPVRDHVRRQLARAIGERIPPAEIFIKKPAKE